jgi:hypothetical protein
MARPALSTLQQRYLDLIGDSDGTIDAFGTRNINLAIKEILNKYNFSWAIATTTITLAAGVADLPNDYNPTWGVLDARIVASSDNDDTVFTKINFVDRDSYSSGDYVCWTSYSPTGDKYVFNSITQTGTVTIYYATIPDDLSLAASKTIVPEVEPICYLAASKNWIGSERDVDLAKEYKQIADQLITAMYLRDIQDTELPFAGSVSFYNLT